MIGAGLAGLTTAHRLTAAGRTVQVLEAAGRIGGRLLRQHVAGIAVDGGGAWVGPSQRRVLALIKELGLTTVPTYCGGRQQFLVDGRVRSSRTWLPAASPFTLAAVGVATLRLDAMAKVLPLRAATLDQITVGTWLRRHAPNHGARTLIEIAVGATTGSGVDDVSLLAFVAHVRAAGGFHQLTGVRGAAQDARIAGGAVGICEGLATRIGDHSIRLNSPVVAVEHHARHAEVRIQGGQSIRAERVVVAVDPATCARIDFGALLNTARRSLHRTFTMGSGIKYHLAYPTPFWRHHGLSGQTYAEDGLARLTFDATPDPSGPGILVGFLGSFAGAELDDGEALFAREPDRRAERVLADLVRFFGSACARPLEYIEQDWRIEPHLSGCVPAARPGVLTAAGPDTAAPTGRVHWAGAEASDVWEGHMEGAVHSADRVVAEVMSSA